MKSIIKIVLVILVITVCFNAARAILGNSQFEDAVHEALLFDPRQSDEEIVAMVTKIADEYGVEIDPANIETRQVGADVIVDMKYTESVVLVPGVYTREWTFSPTASARILTGTRR
jgi:hypothetical protein